MGTPHGVTGTAPLATIQPHNDEVAVVIGYRRHATFWAAALLLLLFSLWLLGEILLPFVVGMGLAYLFSPLANYLQRRGVPRVVGALIVISLIVLGLVALILLFVPMLAGQTTAAIEALPRNLVRLQTMLTDRSLPWLRNLLGESFGAGDAGIGELLSQGAGWLGAFLKGLWAGGAALISIFSLIVVTPIVAFYMLIDWDRMIVKIDSWVPVHQRETVRSLARQTDRAIAGFIRGQSAVCLLLGAFYAIGLTIMGLNFAVLIGLVAGIISFIPYVGSLTGLVLSVGVAMAQFWPDWVSILMVAGIFFLGQFIEGNFLQPKLVGESVGLHPVWIMFALVAFGYLFGFVGLLLAVPLAAALGVLARFAMRQYLASSLYAGPSTVLITDETPPRPQISLD